MGDLIIVIDAGFFRMVTTGNLCWICCILFSPLTFAQDVWRPSNPNLTREEFLSTNGLTREDFNYIKKVMPKLEVLIAKSFGIDKSEIYSNQTSSIGFLDDVLLTKEDVDYLYHTYSKYAGVKRRKRTLIKFGTYPNRLKWPLPIPYKLDNTFSKKAQAGILHAINHWEQNTCIRFKRLKINEKTRLHHLIFVKTADLCASYKGLMIPRQDCDLCSGCVCPQSTELNEVCAKNTGKTIHEVGHIIGLVHEHVRPDRNKFVKIVPRSIIEDKLHNFAIRTRDLIETYKKPYDYGSIMHYGRDTFIKKGHDFVIKTRDPLFQISLGQEAELSFWDKKVANIEYCNETCRKHLPCERGGITNPNKCSECMCPDGFGGKLCDQVLQHTMNCAELFHGQNNITIDTMEEQCIQTPTGTGPRFIRLETRMHCNWYLHAAKGVRIQFYFDTDNSFNVNYCDPFHCCYDWLEVKYKDNLATPGPRFCGSKRHGTVLVSEENEMMVTFRAMYTENDFKFCFKGRAEPSEKCLDCMCGVQSSNKTPGCGTDRWWIGDKQCGGAGCVMDRRQCRCGPFLMTKAQFEDCSSTIDLPLNTWLTCATNNDCARMCLKEFMAKHTLDCTKKTDPRKVRCEEFARMLYGGKDGCDKRKTKFFGKHVNQCIKS